MTNGEQRELSAKTTETLSNNNTNCLSQNICK